MKWLKIIAMFGLLGLWLGAGNHCKLEEIPGLSFLVCCDHDGAASHQDNDCDTDGCAQLEDGLYKTEDSKVAVMSASFLPVCVLTVPEMQACVRDAFTDFLPVASPELSVTWQFSFRAALPPRAPTIVS